MKLNDQLLQLKTNKNGGNYVSGKPLPLEVREEIIRQHQAGFRVTQIGRNLKISHGAVSKILRNYQQTQSALPKIVSFCYSYNSRVIF